MVANKVAISVKRFDSSENVSWIQDYSIIPKKGMTVLEALYYIVENIDGSLSFRYSCRGAVCGSCAMIINDTITLACHTQIAALGSDTINLEPLPRFKVLKDLIVNMDSFLDKYNSIKPYFQRDYKGSKEQHQSPQHRKVIVDSVKCILCASCQASCPLTSFDDNYLGPAPLTAVHRFGFDSRNLNRENLIKQVNNQTGVSGCKNISRCTDVCPKDIEPSKRINEIKDKIKETNYRKALEYS